MTFIFFRIAALASLAMSSSIPRARHAAAAAAISTAKTFTLVLNVTVPGTDFADASVDNVFLSTEHVGAGHTALVPSPSGITGAVDLAYTVNRTIQDGLSPYFWESFTMGSASDVEGEDTYGIELVVGSKVEFGVTIIDDDDDGDEVDGTSGCLAVSSSLKNGTFAICDSGFNAPEAPQYSLYFVHGGDGEDWYATANLPDNCVAVKLLPQCSSSDEFDDSDEVQQVFCYEDVASIDWSQQALCS